VVQPLDSVSASDTSRGLLVIQLRRPSILAAVVGHQKSVRPENQQLEAGLTLH